jgi:hypothetical protein
LAAEKVWTNVVRIMSQMFNNESWCMLLNCVYKGDGFRLFMNDNRKESDSRVKILFQTSGQFHGREKKVHRSSFLSGMSIQ